MKLAQILLAFGVLTAVKSYAALAPFDIVSYDEGTRTSLLALSADKAQIVIYSCPKNKWITDASQCTLVGPVLSAQAFPAFVRNLITKWPESNPTKPLLPLKLEDVKRFSTAEHAISNPRAGQLKSQIAATETELKDATEMLNHMPNSEGFKKQKADVQAKLNLFKAELNRLAVDQATSVSNLVNDLSTSMFALIASNNPKDGNINSFARTQMTDTLLDAVIEKLLSRNNECVTLMKAAAARASNDRPSDEEVIDFCAYLPAQQRTDLVTYLKNQDYYATRAAMAEVMSNALKVAKTKK